MTIPELDNKIVEVGRLEVELAERIRNLSAIINTPDVFVVRSNGNPIHKYIPVEREDLIKVLQRVQDSLEQAEKTIVDHRDLLTGLRNNMTIDWPTGIKYERK